MSLRGINSTDSKKLSEFYPKFRDSHRDIIHIENSPQLSRGWHIMSNMIRKRFTRHGNSRALVFDKLLLDLLRWDEDIEVTITTDGTRFIVEPVKQPEQPQQFDSAFLAAAKRGFEKHHDVFQKLAES